MRDGQQLMELSVVLPTYNQAALLAQCLHALVDQTLEPGRYEIIVVDDGSTDHTADVLGAFRPDSVPMTAVRLSENRGRSAARNVGIARARAPVIVFVDTDVLVPREFLHHHLEVHRRHGPGVMSRGPVVLVRDTTELRRVRPPLLAASPAYLDTANAGVEKAVLLRAGLFDERFQGYGWEDFELGMRLKRLGVRRVFARRAVAFHLSADAHPNDIEAQLHKEEQRAKSAIQFFIKHPFLETRWLIQATPIHDVLYWLQTGGGMLSPKNIAPVAQRLRRAGLDGLAFILWRGVLNRHYAHALAAEFNRHAASLV